MKFKKYIPLLIAAPFVLASCSPYTDISSSITAHIGFEQIGEKEVPSSAGYLLTTPPQGFVLAGATAPAIPTVMNYTITLSSTTATTCQVQKYTATGDDVEIGTVSITDGKVTISGSTYSSNNVDSDLHGVFLGFGACTVEGVASTVTISFTVGKKSYRGTNTSVII